jgi:hypothetical protein
MTWGKKNGEAVKTWAPTDDYLGSDTIVFSDFNEENIKIVNKSVSAKYLRFLIIDPTEEYNRLGFAVDSLPGSWALDLNANTFEDESL